MGILERIKDIEAEMARTQKNKATEYHLGRLKAQLAKLKTELLEGQKSSGGKGVGFDVQKQGDARIVLIGFPSVGKSTLLSNLTGVHSEAADYEFTTLTCVPGLINYRDTRLQLLDLPGIIEGASQGRGRGRQVIAVAKSADLILMMLDATKDDTQQRKLETELEAVGIRLNQEPPAITVKPKKTGGINFTSTVPLTKVDDKLIFSVLSEYKMHNADVVFRGDYSVDQLIDVIEGNRRYIKCLYVFNKIDMLRLDEVNEIARRPMAVVCSSRKLWNMDTLLERIWDKLALVRVYTKKLGDKPDFLDPIILTENRGGSSVKNCVKYIHTSLIEEMKSGMVWGTSAKHCPQQVSADHILHDEDVVQIMTK